MAQFCRLLFIRLLFACSAHAHMCVHDKYIASKNVTKTVSPQRYINHPFETRKDANVSRRLQSANWEPLRIHVDTSDLANRNFEGDAKKALDRVTSTALPRAIDALTKYLHVIRVHGNLRIVPLCREIIDGERCCGENPSCPWDPNMCFDVLVPNSHASSGIEDADFVVYLTANDGDHGHTVAMGAACKLDQHSRPLAGQISINLATIEDSLSTNYLTSVLAHELSHALGWTIDAFKVFRDENGNVRTNTLTRKSVNGKQITLLTTPSITRHVQAHFGCESLTGMELEDQGGTGTAGSHPEKRIFPDSYMGGSTTINLDSYMIDAVALSLFQDSGWYQVKNLEQAGKPSWGRGMGCRVPTHKCNDYGSEANEEGLFCSDKDQPFCTGNYKQVLGYCSIDTYKAEVPSYFQYFSSPYLGGHLQLADFCPRAAQYGDGDCTTGNSHMTRSSLGTQGGQESRCFVSSLVSDLYMNTSPSQALCFRRTCKDNTLEIHVGDTTVSCPLSNTASSFTAFGFHGSILCPPYIGPNDPRCAQICGKEDLECMGIKGSAADGVANGATVPSGVTSPPDQGTMVTEGVGQGIFDILNGLISGNSKPVVVSGRKLLRQGV